MLRLFCLSLGLNMLRLSGSSKFKRLQEYIAVDPNMRYSQLPDLIAQFLSQKIEEGENACDALLGWKNGLRDSDETLVPRMRIMGLLAELLSKSRSIVIAGQQGLSVGLEPLAFMFWRYTELRKQVKIMFRRLYILLTLCLKHRFRVVQHI